MLSLLFGRGIRIHSGNNLIVSILLEKLILKNVVSVKSTDRLYLVLVFQCLKLKMFN